MFNLFSVFYSLLGLLALVITGAVVTGRLRQGARTLMWSGIVMLALTHVSGLVTTAMIQARSPVFAYAALNFASVALTVVGTVLLILAIGRAAREGQPSEPSAPGAPQYPIQGGGYQPQPGNQPYSGDQPDGRPQPYDQPGTWGDPQRPR